eukprot:3472151-Pleurochrysis_carterae.AAC.1
MLAGTLDLGREGDRRHVPARLGHLALDRVAVRDAQVATSEDQRVLVDGRRRIAELPEDAQVETH